MVMAVEQSCPLSPRKRNVLDEDNANLAKETLKDLPKEGWPNYTFGYFNMSDEEANKRLRKALIDFKRNPPLLHPKDNVYHIDLGGTYVVMNKKIK